MRTHIFVVPECSLPQVYVRSSRGRDYCSASTPRSHARRLRRARVLARRAGRLRLLARRAGDLLHLEPRQGRSHFHQQRSLDRPGEWRRSRSASEEHHRRQSRQRLDSALFARWQVHRLPRPAASGIRERPLPADAVRPEDGGEEESDGERSIGGSGRSSGHRIRRGSISLPRHEGIAPIFYASRSISDDAP